MGDTGDFFNDLRAYNKERKSRLGINCPGCNVKEPKRIPTRLLPGQRCRVCGYKDKRKLEA